jgi:hypothetical protein
MSVLQRAAITGLICLTFLAPFGSAWGADRRILGVQVSPDLKHVTIKCDSPVGKHSSFVIQGPCRLVLDLESTELGSVPSKIAVGRDPINEIRLGFLNERARVAIDFGDHAVPPFRIEKVKNDIVVSMERGLAGSGREATRPSVAVPRVEAAASPSGPERTRPRPDAADIFVKHSGAANSMVYVELTNRKNPKQSYRLVIDMDPEAMQPRKATLSDARGNLQKFEISPSTEPGPEAASEPARTAVGPRKGPVASENQESDKKKFQWGAQPAAQSNGASSRSSKSGVLFHIEEYQLEKRKNMATSD